jgi:hypothetical protein
LAYQERLLFLYVGQGIRALAYAAPVDAVASGDIVAS